MTRPALLAALTVVALACSTKDHTSIAVTLESDLQIPAELDAIGIDVTGLGRDSSQMLSLVSGRDGGFIYTSTGPVP
jgi:hypothetical protein